MYFIYLYIYVYIYDRVLIPINIYLGQLFWLQTILCFYVFM
jgi:hypothetical protein